VKKLIFDFTREENVSLFDDTISAVYDSESGVSIIATDLKLKFDPTSKFLSLSKTEGDRSYALKLHTEDVFWCKNHESVKVTFKDVSIAKVKTANVELISTSIGDVSLVDGSIKLSLGELKETLIPLGDGDKISLADLSLLFTRGGFYVFMNIELKTSTLGDCFLDPSSYESMAITGFLGKSNTEFYFSSIEVDGNGSEMSVVGIDAVEELSKILDQEIGDFVPLKIGASDPEQNVKDTDVESSIEQQEITPEKAKEAVELFKKESDNMEMTREQSTKLAHDLLESIDISPLSVKDLGPEELEKSLYKAMDVDTRYQNASHQELLKEASYLTYILLNEKEKKSYAYQIPVGKSYRTYEFGRVDSNTDPSKILFLVMEYPDVWKSRIAKF
jgi:hypothetical protein